MDPTYSSSVAQSTAYFTGFSEEEQKQRIQEIVPFTIPDKSTNSLDRDVAGSSTGLEKDFKEQDYVQAYKMFLGQTMYPFQSIADITNHQFDPSYFDGTEESDAYFNIQENLIGTPLGATELEDPRVTYIDNLLKLREYTSGNLPLDESYIKALFMSETEKGANYYFNQLNDLREAMGSYARDGSAIKNLNEISPTYFSNKSGQGEIPSNRKKVEELNFEKYINLLSETPQVQSNYRRDQLRKAEEVYAPPSQLTPSDIKLRGVDEATIVKELLKSKSSDQWTYDEFKQNRGNFWKREKREQAIEAQNALKKLQREKDSKKSFTGSNTAKSLTQAATTLATGAAVAYAGGNIQPFWGDILQYVGKGAELRRLNAEQNGGKKRKQNSKGGDRSSSIDFY